MESTLYQATLLIVVMVSFIGIWIWAWSRKRKTTFKEASMLPLEEDNGKVPGFDNEKE